MKRIFLRLKQPLRNERGEITFFACFFVVGIVMLISFLLLYASIRITCINIRNGAKMELNNLSGTIYADTYRSQRETNFEEYIMMVCALSSGIITISYSEPIALWIVVLQWTSTPISHKRICRRRQKTLV